MPRSLEWERLVGDGGGHLLHSGFNDSSNYQHYGIGSAIIEDLIEYVENLCEEGTEIMLDLMCAIGREPFYHNMNLFLVQRIN